ncbi:unnamed protein product [Symbiodinium sp. CCMP2592]|nr:unnamed protein product [Symbiodinium sp. CCMP2592]CAE7525161.1 unnamed protein product [Symbiodinium sp. CCMP2592]
MKAKAKAKGQSQADQEDPSQSYDGWKKCGLCRKWLAQDAFNQDQCKCKACNNGTRQFNRLCEKQDCCDKIKKLTAKDWLAVVIQWFGQREKNRLLSVGEKIQFNVMDFIVRLKKSEGTRYARIAEMMWEIEYIEWATKTARGGYLSKEEAGANWDRWKADVTHTRDHKGPRGFLRLKVTGSAESAFVNVTDRVEEYNDFSKEREVEKREKIGKKAAQNAQVMGDRLKLVFAGSAGGDSMNLVAGQSEESLKRSYDRIAAFGLDADEAADIVQLDPEECLDCRQFQHPFLAVGSAAKPGESEEEESSSGKASEEGQSQETPKPQPRPETWMDETKITAAERAWSETISSLETVMHKVIEDAKATLQEFRNSTDKSRYQKEMAILDKRMSWAAAVVDGSIQNKINEQKALQGKSQAAGAGAVTTTSDMSALTRAAPCATWEDLKSLAALRLDGGKYRACADPVACCFLQRFKIETANRDDLKAVTEKLKEQKRVQMVLIQATKAAQSDLTNARKRFEANQKREAEKQKKEEEKKAKQEKDSKAKRPKVKAKSVHAVLNPELMSVLPELPRYAADAGFDWATSAHELLHLPWVQRAGLGSMNQFADLNELLQEFAQAFKQSALRVTDLQSAYSKTFPSTPLVMGEAAKKLLRPALFAIAQNHCSIAKFEPGLLGSLRYHHAGSYLASIWVPKDDEGEPPKDFFKDVTDSVSKATPDDVKEMGKAKLFFMGTVSEGDLLYIPPGALVSVQVGGQGDTFGIRIPLLHVQSQERTQSVAFLLRESENQPRVQMGEILQPVSTALKTLKEELDKKDKAEELEAKEGKEQEQEKEAEEARLRKEKEDQEGMQPKKAAEEKEVEEARLRKEKEKEEEEAMQAKKAAEEKEAEEARLRKEKEEEERLQAKKEAQEKEVEEARLRKEKEEEEAMQAKKAAQEKEEEEARLRKEKEEKEGMQAKKAAQEKEEEEARLRKEKEEKEGMQAKKAAEEMEAEEARLRKEKEEKEGMQAKKAAQEKEEEEARLRKEKEEKEGMQAKKATEEKEAEEARLRKEKEEKERMQAKKAAEEKEAEEARMRKEKEEEERMQAAKAAQEKEVEEARKRKEQEEEERMQAAKAAQEKEVEEARLRKEKEEEERMQAAKAAEEKCAEEARKRKQKEEEERMDAAKAAEEKEAEEARLRKEKEAKESKQGKDKEEDAKTKKEAAKKEDAACVQAEASQPNKATPRLKLDANPKGKPKDKDKKK